MQHLHKSNVLVSSYYANAKQNAMSVKLKFCHKHGSRSLGGQGDMPPLLFEVEGDALCFVPPLLFGSRHCLLFEELLILTVTPCIGVHCSNFHEI